MAEAQAFLASPTSLSQAIVAAEAAAGGKVSTIEYQSGENGAPDLIMADVVLADGSEKTVAINPADGKVMNVTLAENDQQGANRTAAPRMRTAAKMAVTASRMAKTPITDL
ncbi:MAG: hypothetical protein Q8L76_13815 [Cypionkella sp.]|nr:hypothetical protein [Cypionkella sp.]